MGRNITGRDSLIVAKALAYAIESIERLPQRWQEWSDKEDMVLLLDAVQGPKGARRCRTLARSHLERCGLTVRSGDVELADRKPGTIVEFPR